MLETKPGPPEEQQLTLTAEPSLLLSDVLSIIILNCLEFFQKGTDQLDRDRDIMSSLWNLLFITN